MYDKIHYNKKKKIWEELNLTNLLLEKQYKVLIKNTTSGAILFGFGSSEALSGLLNLTSVFLSVKWRDDGTYFIKLLED